MRYINPRFTYLLTYLLNTEISVCKNAKSAHIKLSGFFSSGHLALITIAVMAGLITSSAAVVVT